MIAIDASPRDADTASGAALTASEKTMLVLEAVVAHPRFTDIVAATGLAKATVHRILGTLVAQGFVLGDERGEYLTGPRLVALAGRAMDRMDVSDLVRDHVDALVARTGCTVHVGARNGDEIVYLVRADSDKPYTMPSRVGASLPLHTSGIGKVFLAELEDPDLARLVDRVGLPRRTDRTIRTLDGLRVELAGVRELGYALDREENVSGIHCIAAPVRDHAGRVAYGVSISTLTVEHSSEELVGMADALTATAARISRALGH